MGLNKVMLIGYVGRDPEIRYLDSDSKLATFSLATTEKYRDRNNEIKELTEWHTIVCWRKNADVVEQYVRKGSLLYIEGRIRTRSWDDQSGVKHSVTEIHAETFQILSRNADDAKEQNLKPQTAKEAITIAAEDDDLPF